MSFIDKAKQKIKGVPRILGEETVRVVNYKDDDQSKQTERQVPSKPKPTLKDKVPVSVKSEPPKSANQDSGPGGSVFNMEEKVSFFGKKKKADAIDEAAEELVKVDQNKIKDVLEILEIPATFEIGRETFLPEDITDIEFDYQTPHGYDMGQVGAFVEQARDSVKSYVRLLKLRNEHIAKLATVVDRLQVDLNNQRFDSEQDDDDLNNQNMELKLLVMRLREELAALKSGDDLSTDERQTFEDLQDELSIVTRERDGLRDTIYELKTKVSFMEEDLGVDPVEDEKAFEAENLSSFSDDSSLGFPGFEDDDTLPELDNSGIPNFEEDSESDDTPDPNFNSSFHNGEELTLDEFILENQGNSDEESEEDDGDFSMIEIMDETPAVQPEAKPNPRSISIFDEDEDDELDEIMKQEFGEK
jgi:hypothetical protein